MPNPTKEQLQVLQNDKKNLVVSASAGSGKTWVMIKYIAELIVNKKVPVRRILVLTFTRAAAGEMKERLNKALLEEKADKFILEQIDDLSISDVSTIDAFCEKLIKQNLDRLELDENFKLVEDCSELKQRAFENALNKFTGEQLNEIYFCFRKNKNAIFDVMKDCEEFFATEATQNIEYYINNQQLFFKKSLDLLNENLKNTITEFVSEIREIETTCQEPKYCVFLRSMENLLTVPLSDDFVENVKKLEMMDLPRVPVVSGENRDASLAEKMKDLRKRFKEQLDDVKKYNFSSLLYQKQITGSLAVSLLKLFEVYFEEYKNLKEKLDVVDFVDIEEKASELLKDDDILKSLQERYDYIFIDEYQDTNKIQESIIKPIAKKGYFVAIGDPKQGIYGFRNATMEIMQNDIASFSKSEDGNVLYLRGNFRSDDRILQFINKIFKKIMTIDSVGIDYASTSMLKGEKDFEKTIVPVRIDIIDAENDDDEEQQVKGIYSVKQDDIFIPNKNALEVRAIIARIDSLLMQKIYDEKTGLREIRFDDIVVLMRSRGSLMGDLARELERRGYPVLSDVREQECDEPEVLMLICLLKLLLNRDDDISLISVMSSRLGGFTLSELSQMRLENPQLKSFYQIFVNCKSEKVQKFNEMLDDIKLAASIDGLQSVLIKLLTEKNIFADAKQKSDTKLKHLYDFLYDIKEYDYDIAGAISYFESVGGRKRSTIATGSGAIRLMTIHASKGLEFPIVILAGAGQKLDKPDRTCYGFNKDFGLATFAFDETSNIKAISPNLDLIRKMNNKKEMIDEIMIFYVALTRAKNHLYIVGSGDIGDVKNPMQAKNYLSLINYALKSEFDKLEQCDSVLVDDIEINKIKEVCEFEVVNTKQGNVYSVDENIENYFNFEYPYQNCLQNIKNTVTGLNSEKEEFYHKIDIDETRQDFITLGNAYHETMKILNFEKINNLQDIELEIEKNKQKFKENIDLIDKNIILKNILIIKSLTSGLKIYKEKPFVMEMENCGHNILVQGAIDFFAIGEKNILIDYKFTQENNSEKIINKYLTQINLYTLALEKAFNKKIDKKYILSLKNANLIEIS